MSKFARDLDFIQFHLRVLNESQSPVLISSTLLDSIVVPFLRDLPFSLKRPITDWAKNTAQQQRQQISFTLSFLVSVSLLLQPDRTPNKLDIFVPQKLLVLVVFLHSPPDHRRRFCNFPLRQRKSTQKRARRNYDFNDLHFNYHSMQFAGKMNYEHAKSMRLGSSESENSLIAQICFVDCDATLKTIKLKTLKTIWERAFNDFASKSSTRGEIMGAFTSRALISMILAYEW